MHGHSKVIHAQNDLYTGVLYICRAGDQARFEEGNSISESDNQTLTVVVWSDSAHCDVVCQRAGVGQ